MALIIKKLEAREILDSRGNPTVEAIAWSAGRDEPLTAAVPSGASTGEKEARELRDGDARRYGGLGVLKACGNIRETIASALVGRSWETQQEIDGALCALDGTPGKSRLGANALLAVSLVAARLLAREYGLPLYRSLDRPDPTLLPIPHMNVWNGGVHIQWQGTDFQEYMIVPHGAPSFREALRMGVEIYHALRVDLKAAGQPTTVGDEGGFAPPVASNRAPFDRLLEAIVRVGLRPGDDVSLALDAAASGFYEKKERGYRLRTEKRVLTTESMIGYLEELVRQYPLVLIEDGLDEDDWEGWRALRDRLGDRVRLVGDDIFCTNPRLIERGIRERTANAALIKLNQIGTVSETLEAIATARRADWDTMVSHRSGETEDPFLADLCVAAECGLVKTGAPARSERNAKYNRLLEIERELGDRARYPARSAG
jgi:enolase